MSTGDTLVVQAGPGVQLVVHPPRKGADAAVYSDGELWLGEWPRSGQRLALIPTNAEHVYVISSGRGIWFGRILVSLPWLELLKVADYLRLPIPVLPTEVVAPGSGA